MVDKTSKTRPIKARLTAFCLRGIDVMAKIPPRETDLLLWLLENGPAIPYQIRQKSEIKLSTVYADLARLEEKNMVESRDLKELNKTKGEREYGLTLYGLCLAVLKNGPDWAEQDCILRYWQHLAPMVFSKWLFFRENRIEDAAKVRLFGAAASFCADYCQVLEDAKNIWGEKFRSVYWFTTDGESELDRFSRYFYDLRAWTSDRYRWASVCKTDKDIADLIAVQVKKIEKEHKELLHIYGD